MVKGSTAVLVPSARGIVQPAKTIWDEACRFLCLHDSALRGYAVSLRPVKYDSAGATRQVTALEVIGRRRYYVAESPSATTPRATDRFFFDAEPGLLHRVQTTLPTALGTRVEETTFEDDRDVQGVKLPVAVSTHFMEDETIFRIPDAQINIAVDPANFEPPALTDRGRRRR
jgi:hypothetical protein